MGGVPHATGCWCYPLVKDRRNDGRGVAQTVVTEHDPPEMIVDLGRVGSIIKFGFPPGAREEG